MTERLFWGTTRAYSEAPYWRKKGEKPLKRKAYLAGPMRGYDQFNFPAFDKAKAILEEQGWEVFSPADHDREGGFDETLNSLDGFDLREAFKWDIGVILNEADAIIMLPGWEKSTGVTKAELPVAQTIGLEVYEIGCLKSGNVRQLSAAQVQDFLDLANPAYERGYDAGYDAGVDGYAYCDCDCDGA